jgi:hypothetical protein
MTPEFGFPDRRFRQVRCFLLACFNDAAADIGAADIDGKNAVMAFENP